MKLNSKQITKYLIQLIILFTVLLFIVIPYTHNLNLIYKNYTTEAKSLELKFKTGEDFEQLRNHYDELNNQIPTYEELLLNQGEELTLIQDLEQIAEKYNLIQTLTLDLQRDEITEDISSIPFNFHLAGDFYNVLEYLNEISNKNYNLTIQNLNIKQDGQGLEVNLLGYTYWLSI